MWNTPIGQTVICAKFSRHRNRLQPDKLYLCALGDAKVYNSDYSFGAEFVDLRNDVGRMLEHIRRHRRVLLELGFSKAKIDSLLCQLPEYRTAYGRKHRRLSAATH